MKDAPALHGVWMLSRPYGKAHYLLAGQPVCLAYFRRVKTAWRGFNGKWLPSRPHDHKCNVCRKITRVQCSCGACKI